MTDQKQNAVFGFGFLVLGLALMLTADPWWLGIAFLIIGGQRLYVASTMSGSSDEPARDDIVD